MRPLLLALPWPPAAALCHRPRRALAARARSHRRPCRRRHAGPRRPLRLRRPCGRHPGAAGLRRPDPRPARRDACRRSARARHGTAGAARRRSRGADGHARPVADALRGREQAALAHRRRRRVAGDGGGAGARPRALRHGRPHRLSLCARGAVRAVPDRAAGHRLPLRPQPARHPRQCAARGRARRAGEAPARRGLCAGGGLCRRGGRGDGADDAIRLARRALLPAHRGWAADARPRRARQPERRAARGGRLHRGASRALGGESARQAVLARHRAGRAGAGAGRAWGGLPGLLTRITRRRAR